MSIYGENILVEQPAIELFQSFNWDFINCFDEFETSHRDVSTEMDDII
jgi:hypothetical protein